MAKERKQRLAREMQLAAARAAGTAPADPARNRHRRKTPERGRGREGSAHQRRPAFSPERQSGYVVNRKGGTHTTGGVHGRVLNALARRLSAAGIKAANTGLGGEIRPDLLLPELPAVIEVKSGGSWEDVIHGIGQCFAYSALREDPSRVGKVLVVPASTDKEKLKALMRLGIQVVGWSEDEGEVAFSGLERALPLRG